ncbi:MAG: phosphate--AMP phosphotransferase, partial [Spirochaetes bacterium GWB1_27_13]
MLENIDLSKEMDKNKYKQIIEKLELKLGELQRNARELKIPLIIVFEGWDAAGKGTLINNLILSLDPRGFKVYTKTEPTEEEYYRPFLWRFWNKLPSKGLMSIFDRSWYGRVIEERVDNEIKEKDWQLAYEEIKIFEKQLIDDGNLIIKFFLHIDKKEQKKRFKKLDENKATSWRVTKEDWKHNEQYDDYLTAYEEMLKKTNPSICQWNIIESTDEKFATIKVFNIFIEMLEQKINDVKNKKITTEIITLDKFDTPILSKIDLSKMLTKEEYQEEFDKCKERIRELEYKIYKKRIPVLIMYEGCDAAGKGGNIKRITKNMDPRGYEVIPIAAPNDIEKAHHYLWRFWQQLPKAGHIAIFDRTWYGRVLVERVEKFCSENDWKRSYKEINDTEAILDNSGFVIVKFWLQ